MIDKRIIKKVKCVKCGKDHEHYDVYSQGNFKYKYTGDKCPECHIEEENGRIQREALEEQQNRLIRRFERYSEIPFDMQSATFDNYVPENKTQETAKEITLKFANDEYEKSTLFFQGDTGLGKTHLSFSAYKKFIDEKRGAIFIDLPSLLSDIRSTYNNDRYDHRAKTQERIMESINNCELLVLDDIGAEYVKPDANGYESWAADILFQIVNSRQGKKNIYTTNFTSKHLTKKYGMLSKRIISRLMSNAKVIKVEGSDYRLKGLE